MLSVCSAGCMLCSVYAVLGVNSCSWHGEIERDDSTVCSGDDGTVVDEKERWRMKRGKIWRIRADMRHQVYGMPDWVWKTSCQCNYAPDRDSYLPYQEW